jgi:hypothetical protein
VRTNYGGVLTMAVEPGTLAAIAAGKVALPKSAPVTA